MNPSGLSTPTITPRNLAIARYIAQGKTTKDISREMGIARQKVEYHIHKLCRMIGVNSRVEIALWAVGNGVAENPFSPGDGGTAGTGRTWHLTAIHSAAQG
jgi:DNA-binding CsgD family transcriptional regulator